VECFEKIEKVIREQSDLNIDKEKIIDYAGLPSITSLNCRALD